MARRLRKVFVATATLAVAAAGGLGASVLGLPLPWLLGSLIGTALLAVSGLRIAGEPPAFPERIRLAAVPVIGVMIGAGVSADVFSALGQWWPSLLLLVPFILALQLVNFAVFHRLGGYDLPTAFFAASPGGLIESVLIGESRGGTVALMSMQHFSRIALSVLIIPVLFTFVTGQSVGSAAGASLAAPENGSLTVRDAVLLAASGLVGTVAGRALRLPAAIMIGPFLASAAIHAGGLTNASVPPVLVMAAQVILGLGIGLRFVGQGRRTLAHGFGLALVALSLSLGLAGLIAIALSASGIATPEAVFLAFAPGGLAEMSLIAISLGISPVFVTTHHVLRIVIAISLSSLVFRLVCAVLNRRGRMPRA